MAAKSKTKEPAKLGRPSEYTPEVAAKICARMVEGQSLRTICKDEDLPSAATVFVWLSKHPDFVEQYARAREQQAEALFEEILEISDDGSNDWMERNDKDNKGYQANGEHIQRSRLRVDARKWMASKMAPKKYGDKSSVELSGKDGAPLTPVINVTIGGTEPSSSS